MKLEERRQRLIKIINELFDESDSAERIATQIKEQTGKWWNYVYGADYYKGKAAGYLQSARRLMKLKREIEIEMGH